MTDAPDYAEPITAVRAWKAEMTNVLEPQVISAADVLDAEADLSPTTIAYHEELRLKSPYRGQVWKPGEEMEAECDNPADAFIRQWQVSSGGADYFRSNQISMQIEIELSSFGSETLKEGIVLRLDPKSGSPVVEAVKPKAQEPPPHPGHSCGIYALSALKNLENQVLHLQDKPAVFGLVELTGRIVPGAAGWRAQRAKISAFVEVHPIHRLLGKNKTMEEIAVLYGVPVISKKEAEELISNPEDFGAKPGDTATNLIRQYAQTMPPPRQYPSPGYGYQSQHAHFSVGDPSKPVGNVLKGGIA